MKSHESDLIEIAICVYKDAMAQCTVNQPDERDIETLISRVKHEGLSFLTITLPSLGQDLERSLSERCIRLNSFRSFSKRGTIPAFLQGMFSLVFNPGTGRILDEPEVAAIVGIRQIAYTFKKLKLPCTHVRVRKAFSEFAKIELDLSEPLASDSIEYFDAIATNLWNSVLGGRFNSSKTVPKHGPGATAERISGNSKYEFGSWHSRLEPYFPILEFAFPNGYAYFDKAFGNVSTVPLASELPVRVITVPKTLKSPRIIAIEPVCMQYTQQAISRYLVDILETSDYTAGHINFCDQSVNQKLAIIASKDCSMATLDLSSASDRVPLSLVERMLSCSPDLLKSVLACRSTRAQLPSGDILSLKKFASMGSALCFPIESMYFYTICIAARMAKRNLPVTAKNIFEMSRAVYVYGDDIIVPTDDAVAVVDYLQKYYCKVNTSKSFWSGNFRESCGVEAFSGYEVTPTYLRELPPNNRRSTSALLSWIASSNLFYKRGFWRTSAYLLERCEDILGELPIISEKSAAVGKISYQRVYSIERWGKRYQRPEVRAWVAAPVYRTDKLDGYPALLKCLLRLEHSRSSIENEFEWLEPWQQRLTNDVATDAKHLSRSAQYGAVTLKRRWTSPC